MNCNPGDLAVVVREWTGRAECNAPGHPTIDGHVTTLNATGKIVRCLSVDIEEKTWQIQGIEVDFYVTGGGYFGSRASGVMDTAPDAILQPIRGQHDPDIVTTDRTIDEGVTA